MWASTADLTLVTFISLSLLLLNCKASAALKQFQATVYNTMNNNTFTCHDGLMSVYISKVQFAGLPSAIYVQDETSGYYQAIAIAKQCHYSLRETDTLIILTVATHGCFVRRKKYTTNLTVVIMALADRGKVEIVKSIPIICERKIQEVSNNTNPLLVSKHLSCSKEGFNITIHQTATVPPLNLDTVWIPSNQGHDCKPKKRSKDAVTFSFPFSDCGTQSKIVDGNITYWVNVELKPFRRGSIFHDPPFRLTVRCSFALAQSTQLGFKAQEDKSEYPSTLKSEGIFRTEMRFAKDSNYRTFFSARGRPIMTELGQPVYVEVFVLKHEDKDLVLLLEDCWATPTKNPNDPKRWNLLVTGCPFSGDSHRTVVLPVVSSKERKYPSLHKWFVVKLFSFVKPPTSQKLVYFHCDVEICKGPDCLQSCINGRHQLKRIIPRESIPHSVVSGGPLLLSK